MIPALISGTVVGFLIGCFVKVTFNGPVWWVFWNDCPACVEAHRKLADLVKPLRKAPPQ